MTSNDHLKSVKHSSHSDPKSWSDCLSRFVSSGWPKYHGFRLCSMPLEVLARTAESKALQMGSFVQNAVEQARQDRSRAASERCTCITCITCITCQVCLEQGSSWDRVIDRRWHKLCRRTTGAFCAAWSESRFAFVQKWWKQLRFWLLRLFEHFEVSLSRQPSHNLPSCSHHKVSDQSKEIQIPEAKRKLHTFQVWWPRFQCRKYQHLEAQCFWTKSKLFSS